MLGISVGAPDGIVGLVVGVLDGNVGDDDGEGVGFSVVGAV